ncbi:MAG: DUF4255 domain-containing protein [Lewinellaceae bacterium]|nr:DUF4255 domain-containing protein [Lewinellaceae bacterium]
MIHTVLQAITKDLNAFLQNRFKLNEDMVSLSSLVALDGSVSIPSENKIVCTLLNIEQERMNLNAPHNKQALVNQPINLNLYVLFSAYFSANNYIEALKAISYTIGFFQGKQVFTNANTANFPATIDKIVVEMVNMDMKDISNFWTALGANHLPCVLFRLRMISITADVIIEEYTLIRGIQSDSGS